VILASPKIGESGSRLRIELVGEACDPADLGPDNEVTERRGWARIPLRKNARLGDLGALPV
jgi:hypothetical protein